MAELTNPELLRMYLGEPIPVGGSENDTMFTDAEIQNFLDSNGDNVNLAAAQGWNIKAGAFAKLVDMSEGSSRRQLSQRHEHALNMAAHYNTLAGVDGAFGRGTRIRDIERA